MPSLTQQMDPVKGGRSVLDAFIINVNDVAQIRRLVIIVHGGSFVLARL